MGELLNIKWLKPHQKYAYFEGDISELEADQVAELTESGHVIYFPGVVAKEENPLPEDLPCRELLFENGFISIDQIRSTGESLKDIKGIANKTFAAITAYLSV